MKVAELITQAGTLESFRGRNGKTLQQALLEETDCWSNAACIGYAFAAMQRAGVSYETISSVLQELQNCFDDYTVTEAESFGFGQ